MANEFKKPTAWDVTTYVTNPTYAYDVGNTSTSSGDTSSAANITATGTTTAAVSRTQIAQTWAAAGQTYTALQLKMRIALSVSDTSLGDNAGATVAISYSTDGTTYTPWYSYDSFAQGDPSGIYSLAAFDLTPITLSTSQNLSNLKVKVVVTGNKGVKLPICKFDTGCLYDGMLATTPGSASVDIYDIYTDGTYSTGSITSFSSGLAIPPVRVAYGVVATLTCNFSGGALSVTPGSWATWVSGTGQSSGALFSDTSWTATCGSATATATTLIATPTIGTPTFSKNPCTVGDLVSCSATIGNATGEYLNPAWSDNRGASWYPIGGPHPPNQIIPTLTGSYTITATVQGPLAGTVTSSAVLTVYAAATGSLNGPAGVTVNNGVYYITPTFANGTAVMGTTQGGSDISASLTTGVAVSRACPSATGNQTTWMRVTNPAGDFIDASWTTMAYAAPTASISASNTNPLWGAPNVTVTPSGGGDVLQIYIGTSVYGVEISGNAANNTAVGVQTSGFTTTTTYYSTVFNHAATYVGSAGVTVTPQTPVVSAISPANVSRTTANGESVAYVASVSGIYNTALTWKVDGITGGNAAVGTIDATGHYTPGTTLGAHTVSAVAANGASSSTTVYVYAIPTCSLGADTTTPAYGANVTLTPTFTNDADNLVTIGTSPGASDVSAGVASGGNVVVTPLVTTTYWARAVNGAGLTADSSITITVPPPPARGSKKSACASSC